MEGKNFLILNLLTYTFFCRLHRFSIKNGQPKKWIDRR